MNISTNLAQTIVTDMKEILNQEINYISKDGIIIASTDVSRIGSFHGAGKKVAETNSDLVIHFDGQFTGALKGINMPVNFNNEIVGVIGITGEKEDVEKYVKIIRRFTEMLIKDAYINKYNNQQKENQRMIIEELLSHNYEKDGNDIINDLKVFNLTSNLKRVVVVSEIKDDGYRVGDKKESIYKIYSNKLIGNPENLMMQNKNNIIMILQTTSQEHIEHTLTEIAEEIRKKYVIQVKFGIGTFEEDLRKMKQSYEKALVALNWTSNSEEESKFYNEMDIEIILESVPKETTNEFCSRIISHLNEKDIDEYKNMIRLFEQYNGSIKKVSEALFIHKNTLQYKLNRLCNKTGYDMRNYSDFVVLKIAFLLV